MDGLVILNAYNTIPSWGIALFMWSAAIATLAAIAILIAETRKGKVCAAVVVLICITIIIIGLYKVPRRTEVKAYAQDSLTWNDLSEKYDVIKVEGSLLTLVEKDE